MDAEGKCFATVGEAVEDNLQETCSVRKPCLLRGEEGNGRNGVNVRTRQFILVREGVKAAEQL